MVDAMSESSPGYFKQFQKNFRFFISEEKPKSTFAKVSAICMHIDSLYCGVLPANHFHVLFDVSDVATDFLKKLNFILFHAYIQLSIVYSRMARTWWQSVRFSKNWG